MGRVKKEAGHPPHEGPHQPLKAPPQSGSQHPMRPAADEPLRLGGVIFRCGGRRGKGASPPKAPPTAAEAHAPVPGGAGPLFEPIHYNNIR